jgi:hypothetical protein
MGTSRRPDSRREPGFEDADIPTEVTARPKTLGANVPEEPLPRVFNDPADQDPENETEVTTLTRGSSIPRGALPRGVRAWLEVRHGPCKVNPVPITKASTVLGRGRQADIRIADPKLSRSHTVIFFVRGEFRIRDDRSANGTLLNGSNVVEYALHDRDEIVVGGSIFIFRAELKDGLPPPK